MIPANISSTSCFLSCPTKKINVNAEVNLLLPNFRHFIQVPVDFSVWLESWSYQTWNNNSLKSRTPNLPFLMFGDVPCEGIPLGSLQKFLMFAVHAQQLLQPQKTQFQFHSQQKVWAKKIKMSTKLLTLLDFFWFWLKKKASWLMDFQIIGPFVYLRKGPQIFPVQSHVMPEICGGRIPEG